MSEGDIKRYVVTIRFHEETLTQINELNNQLTRAGFTLTLSDEHGKVHELGTNTFGIITPQSENEVRDLATGLAEGVLDVSPDVDVVAFDEWLTHKQ
ncbi:hypothetical protein CHU32_04765 [Superficieibacter electus]|uniref:Uncharacterized protein n=1 Tax=Superficieibacter electus TaxID=2022662 RepID=A0A2P5GU79_9ENTR|nr:type V toxin-antitoxin system endoribonuclease antitoxin GhoS [Superficieibacter electus]POP47253.1 hypothetical protein CHU33_03215 [Superficieibacter electus]POP50099.1 hypothetical protein CHU32_04765 [Superficieibacter electus]